MLAIEHLDNIIKKCQQAKMEIESNNKRRVPGLMDEIQFDAEAVKWIFINKVIDEEGKF